MEKFLALRSQTSSQHPKDPEDLKSGALASVPNVVPMLDNGILQVRRALSPATHLSRA
jgi:hypothetical protein